MTSKYEKPSYTRSRDPKRAFEVLEFFKENGTLAQSFDLFKYRREVAAQFQENLEEEGLRLPKVVPESSILSYRYFITSLTLYLKFEPSYLSRCVKLMTELFNQFNLLPEDVFRYDQECVSKRNSLFGKLGCENYYSHPLYISHILVENVSAERIFYTEKIKNTIKRLGISWPLRILDIGCGMGGSLYLFPGAYEKVGIDISYPMIETCKRVAGPKERYKVMDCNNIQYPSRSFDLILCFDLLEHVTRPKHTLKGLCRVLKPDGLVVIVYPFGNYDWDSHISLVDKQTFDCWLYEFKYLIVEEIIPPSEGFPAVFYLLKR